MKPGEKRQTNHTQYFFPSDPLTHGRSPALAARGVGQSLPWVWVFLERGNWHGRKSDSFSYWWPTLGTSNAGCKNSLRAPLARAVISASIPSVSIYEQLIAGSLVFSNSIHLMLFLMPRCWSFSVISFSLTLPEKGIPPVVFIE